MIKLIGFRNSDDTNFDNSRHRVSKMDIVAAVEVLQLAIPLARTVPFVGSILESSLLAVLHIIHVKDVRLPLCLN